MPNLYSVRFKHYAPKDSAEGIIGYIIAEDAEKIYEFLKNDSEMNGINIYAVVEEDPEDEDDEFESFKDDDVLEIYDSEYNLIGTETYKEKMIRIGGQMYDEDAEVNDAYYGVTHYGWKLEKRIENEEDISILMDYLDIIVLE